MKCTLRSTRFGWWSFILCAGLVAIACTVGAQNSLDAPTASSPLAAEHADQIATILGISSLVSNARQIRSQTPCGTLPDSEEIVLRQEILEHTMAASFQVDGVLAELSNEHARLFELSSGLQSRRDRAVNMANVANLVTGTGLGILVNALQFSNSTASVGDGVGVASGVASTVLSVVGLHLQRGPQSAVGRVPNMLALLFDRSPGLNSYYPQTVLEYLHSVPPGESEASGSRLDQLMQEWTAAGRIGPSDSRKSEQQIARLTSGLDDKTKLSIDDISNRMAMLSDVAAEVTLMKRDLADLLLSVVAGKRCVAK